MRLRALLATPALALFLAPVLAQPQATQPQTRTVAGFSTERLARIDRALQQRVDSGRIGGAVALVMRDGEVVYERAVGWSDKENRKRMTPDALFRIASQTKALTSVAIMMLVEEGTISLSDPVSTFIPAYASTTVLSRTDTTAIVPARRRITIRDLLTHTAGISYGTGAHVAERYRAVGLGPAAGYGWYTADKDEPVCTTMERLASLPFVAQPGEAFVYGYNTDILGCVIERATGVPLNAFIRTRITEPLGMRDTHFFVPADKRGRLTAVYASAPNHVGTLFNAAGRGFGLGFQTTDRAGANGMTTVGSYGWGGAYSSTYLVDPREGLVIVFMMQMLPDGSDIRGKLTNLVYQALVEPRGGM